MQLPRPFIRLALTVDADRLRSEIRQFGPTEWRAHPQGHPGNSALPLIARRGNPHDDGVAGPMGATPQLAHCPYLRQVLAALRTPIGRSRLMRLDSGAEATPHVDTNYYWSQRVRVHVPIVTTPGVIFVCGDEEIHMAPGEVWIFDTWRPHNVLNPPGVERIHLVVDTVGSDAFWSLARNQGVAAPPLPYVPGSEPSLTLETVNLPVVMNPYEFGTIWSGWCADASGADPNARAAIDDEVRRVQLDWRANWAAHGDAPVGWPGYAALIRKLREISARHAGNVKLANRQDLARLIESSLIPALHSPDLAEGSRGASSVPDLGQVHSTEGIAAAPPTPLPPRTAPKPSIVRPLIILCAPRSGSTLLFERLAACTPDWYTVGHESHVQFEGISALNPARRGFDSNALEASDATPEVTAELRARFLSALRDRDGRPASSGGGAYRLLEKTPKNALRVPFLRAVFPDARFLYLWREPEECLASLIEGWQSGSFVTHSDLPGWPGPSWSYLLVPGWRALAGRPLEEIVAAQWRTTQEQLLRDLAEIPPDDVRALDLADFLESPEQSLRAICDFAGVRFDRPPPADLPLSLHTLTPPAPDKWRRHEDKLESVLPSLMPIATEARAFVTARKVTAVPAAREPEQAVSIPLEAALPQTSGAAPAAAEAPPPPENPGLGSVHTDNLPEILRQLGISLLVTNYQGGKLIAVRPYRNTVNTHFLNFDKPMGLAVDRNRLFVGTQTGIREFRNMPHVAKRLVPPNRNDGVYVFRNYYVTGNVDIHEMALGADNECWFINTRFSCLCTLDREHSFRPRWRPKFITGLLPEDRCHLNGIAMVDGRPRWLTALGATDTEDGWRANKLSGGVLLDYETRDVVVPGLAMPHSPRWYRNRLWVLESSRGNLAIVDPASGRLESVARVPGFARGLDFVGPLAFIGLSQLRDTNTFVDIPESPDNADHRSGVWVVNIENGETIAILKFGEAVQEVFAVQAVPGILYPEIIDETNEVAHTTYLLPDEAYREVRQLAPEAAH
jgi:uncharacterized protein (TIGR03032 family)